MTDDRFVRASTEVSVVMCTHDRTDDLSVHLPRVIASCRNSLRRCEVIVVDNAPSDTLTQRLVEQTSCRYVVERRQGLGRARNVGADRAQGEIVLFVDDDVDVPSNWVDAMSGPILAGDCDLTAGAIRPGREQSKVPASESVRSTLLLEPVDSLPSHLIGASFGCHRRVFAQVSFDPDLGAGSPYGSAEDVFFYEQAKEAGFVIHGCSRAPAVHNFDVDRLDYLALSGAAVAIGRSQAYISHHWLHSELRFLRMRIGWDWLRLQRSRLKRRSVGGMSDQEFRRRVALSCKRQLLRERGDQPHYEFRGLKRLARA